MSQVPIAIAFAIALTTPLALAVSPPSPPFFVPAVAEGYTITPLAALPVITAITFGPGDDLYATTIAGAVVRVDLEWTPAGPVAVGASEFASGFSLPLGLTFGPDGALYVADSHGGAESGRVDGRVTRVDSTGSTVVVDGLPNGRHNTNNMRFGPDGRLYITNGNPNDNGVGGGDADVFPYSGAILSVDAAVVSASPAIFRWLDANNQPIPEDQLATHAVNADFASKVDVLAWGFRNVYDIAFAADGTAYTGMNGADDPSSQDAVYRIEPGTDYGFPFCYNEGAPGATSGSISVVTNPTFPGHDCSGVPPATALIGWHTCATGLDVAPAGSGFGDALFVGECGPFFPHDTIPQAGTDANAWLHSTGHKVRRVALDANGEATEVRDFISGLALPIDVHFGPDGAMYVADIEMVFRVAPVAAAPVVASEPPAFLIATGPRGDAVGYLPPALAVPVGADLTYANGDLLRHNVVALDAYGDDSQPWCHTYSPGRCPLFWTPLIGLGETTPVLGLDALEPLQTYRFYCTIHAGMVGTLVALPPAPQLA